MLRRKKQQGPKGMPLNRPKQTPKQTPMSTPKIKKNKNKEW